MTWKLSPQTRLTSCARSHPEVKWIETLGFPKTNTHDFSILANVANETILELTEGRQIPAIHVLFTLSENLNFKNNISPANLKLNLLQDRNGYMNQLGWLQILLPAFTPTLTPDSQGCGMATGVKSFEIQKTATLLAKAPQQTFWTS